MKSITYLCMPLMAILIVLFSCTEDERTQHSQVQFGVNLIGNDQQALTTIPDGSYIMISITNSVGEPVISYEKIDMIAGTQFLSLPMDLPPGNYKLTGLSLVDENSDLIRYTVPQKTAPLSRKVSHALNFAFSIGNGERSTFNFDLLDVSKCKPEEFGLATFKVSRNKLKIMVHADGIKKPVTAEAYILQGTDTIDHYMLEARMNQVALHGDPAQQYSLWITKAGYASYTKQFTVGELKNGKPWVIMLEQKPAFTMLAYAGEFTFGLVLSGTINLDWGDDSNDTTVTVASSTPSQLWLTHVYPVLGNYPITIKGDVDQITEFYSFYGAAPIDSIDFAPLVNLTGISFGLTRSPHVIDLTHNNKLESVNLAGLSAAQILLPAEHYIDHIIIDGLNMTPEAVDAVINNIYANSIARSITNGFFILNANLYEVSDMVGPPSASAVEKLRILQNDYGWYIEPAVVNAE